jgi:hypothetical protein
MPRRDLFPNQPEDNKSSLPYYKITLKHLQQLEKPIIGTPIRIKPPKITFAIMLWKQSVGK